jgi:hypothetical protein
VACRLGPIAAQVWLTIGCCWPPLCPSSVATPRSTAGSEVLCLGILTRCPAPGAAAEAGAQKRAFAHRVQQLRCWCTAHSWAAAAATFSRRGQQGKDLSLAVRRRRAFDGLC